MPTDKPARMITKLTEALREKSAEIAKLEKLAEDRFLALERATIRIDEGDEIELRLRQKLAVAETKVAELANLNMTAAAALVALEAERDTYAQNGNQSSALVAKLDANFGRVVVALGLVPSGADTDTVVACIALHRDSTRRLDERGLRGELVDAQRSALTKILDVVRGRMKRKEVEAESAVLNRKALGAVVPGRNVR